MAKTYGWTQQETDHTDADLIDWLCAIQGVENELEQEAIQKQNAEMKRATSRRPRR